MEKPLKIIPLGGLGEIGKNMMALEYGEDIVVIDAGVMFPDDDLPGVDLVIPDITYLKDNVDKVRAILITHGHEDHTGALPYILRDINVPVFAPNLAKGLIEVKLKSHKGLKNRTVESIEPGSPVKIGELTIEWFRVCHSIPDAMGLVINTPLGKIIHTGDFKIDHTPVDGKATDLGILTGLTKDGVLLLLSDSTYAEVPGYTASEEVVGEALDRVVRDAPGRVVVATFASLISRVQQLIDAASKHDRKITFVGRSMVENVKLALKLGYLYAPAGVIVTINELINFPPNRIVIVTTGSQGEPTSALVRIATGEHKEVHIIKGDTVVISATPIPGNETVVSKTINNLLRQGAKVLHDKIALVHVHGHASQEELKLMLRITNPKYFLPVHGEYRHLVAHALLAKSLGIPEENTFVLEDGNVLEINSIGTSLGEGVKAGPMYVSGSHIWGLENSSFQDRKILARNGVLVVVITVDKKTKKMLKEPELVTSGVITGDSFVSIRKEISVALKLALSNTAAADFTTIDLEKIIVSEVSSLLNHQIGRKPMLIPLAIEM